MRTNRRKKKKLRKRILILCEGETEKNYFQAIKEDPEFKNKLSAIHPQIIVAKNPTPKRVVDEAIQRIEKESQQDNPYDAVWVVFDHDNHENRKVAFQKAKKMKIKIGFSAICFEFWYLLHFSKNAQAFLQASQLIRALKKYYPNYAKAKRNDFLILKERLPNAIINAQWLRKEISKNQKFIYDQNPWTDIDILVNKLINL